MARWRNAARIVFDLFIFALICAAEVALRKWAKPHKRGFFCDDESLQYPYREGTIGVMTLIAIVLAVPTCVILAVELFKQPSPLSGSKRKSQTTSPASCRLRQRLVQCYIHIGYYLFGLALNLLATHVTKHTVGRLRPHFFAVCQPRLADGSSCLDLANHGRYIEKYECEALEFGADIVRQLSQSFPSAHSSTMFYSMVHVAIYLQAKLGTHISKLLKHLLQFVFVMLAWYVALTRISDYWHHWSDVLAGALLGTLVAVLVTLFVAHLITFEGSRCGSSVAPKSGAKSSTASPVLTSSPSKSAGAVPTVLPGYTFGTLPYLAPHPHAAAAAAVAAQQQAQYAQTYHNYGYVP